MTPRPTAIPRRPSATALKTAADVFDSLWQAYRVNDNGDVSRIGITADMWHGKVMEELGDYLTAGDIYDEVLANAEPGVGQLDRHGAALRPGRLFPLPDLQAQGNACGFHRRGPLLALPVSQLLQDRRLPGGRAGERQGDALEAAKTGNDRKLAGEAREVLVAISKVRSSFQGDAIKLLRG